MTDLDRLREARDGARTVDEYLAAGARLEYFNRRYHDEGKRSVAEVTLPDDQVPTPELLATSAAPLAVWLDLSTAVTGAWRQALDERRAELAALVGELSGAGNDAARQREIIAKAERLIVAGGPNADALLTDYWQERPMRSHNLPMRAEEVFHLILQAVKRREAPEAATIQDAYGVVMLAGGDAETGLDAVREAFAPIIRWWLFKRKKAGRDFRPKRKGSAPRFEVVSPDDARMLNAGIPDGVPVPPDEHGQLSLSIPRVSADTVECLHWLLYLFDQVGGTSPSQRFTPWELHLFIEALVHLDVRDRDGTWHVRMLETPYVESLVKPDGWGSNRARDWRKLPAALRGMLAKLSYLPIEGVGLVAMVYPSVIPEQPGDPWVEFTMRVPSSAAHGNAIDMPTLRGYLGRYARYRAYLVSTVLMGQSAMNGHGVTRTIPESLLRGRKVQPADRLIINPAARYVKGRTSLELTQAVGFDPKNRHHIRAAMRAFEGIAGRRGDRA